MLSAIIKRPPLDNSAAQLLIITFLQATHSAVVIARKMQLRHSDFLQRVST